MRNLIDLEMCPGLDHDVQELTLNMLLTSTKCSMGVANLMLFLYMGQKPYNKMPRIRKSRAIKFQSSGLFLIAFAPSTAPHLFHMRIYCRRFKETDNLRKTCLGLIDNIVPHIIRKVLKLIREVVGF